MSVEPKALSLPDAAWSYGVDRKVLYAAIKSGQLPAKRITSGGRFSIGIADLKTWHDNLPNATDPIDEE